MINVESISLLVNTKNTDFPKEYIFGILLPKTLILQSSFNSIYLMI